MRNNGSRWLWLLLVVVVAVLLILFLRHRPGGDGNGEPTPPPVETVVVVGSPTVTPVPPTPTCVPFGMGGGSNKNVTVGPDIAVCNPDCLSMGSTETVTWTGNTGGTNGIELLIEFDEKPFQNMFKQANGRYVATCSNLTCQSGAVVTTPLSGWYPCRNEPTRKCKDLKYWQIFKNWPGGDKVADGRIIIKW
ncbi:MAG TPA: hypothetical protein VGK26_00300 [Thermoanaerobaculia bacterium]